MIRVGLALLFAMTLDSFPGSARAAPEPARENTLAFFSGPSTDFLFDTGVLRGKLRADGISKGLSEVVYVPGQMILDRSLGLFSHYRVFSASHRYGTAAWDWPSQARLEPDGSLRVRWPPAGERPFELRAHYRFAMPNALDLETTVVAGTNLVRFESFLASYFAPGFTNALVYATAASNQGLAQRFVVAEKRLGTWLSFPRDSVAESILGDGRWKLPPNPVDWVSAGKLAKPLAIRRDPAAGVTAVLMSPPGECFAICAPEQTEPHYSMYLSLFGCDLKTGQSARARARLWIALSPSEVDILKAYDDYLREISPL